MGSPIGPFAANVFQFEENLELKRQNREILYAFSLVFFFFFAIAKISTREIRLPNIREIKYARKLVRIMYL